MDSQLLDTPSHYYNVHRKTTDNFRQRDPRVPSIEEEDISDLGELSGRELPKTKRKKKEYYQKIEYYIEPGDKEKQMAKVYGGKTSYKKITKVAPILNIDRSSGMRTPTKKNIGQKAKIHV